MILVVVSKSFFRYLSNTPTFRSLLLSKLDSQRHRIIIVSLGNDVIAASSDNNMAADRKLFSDSASVYPRLSVRDVHFVEKLLDYLPRGGVRQSFESMETDESVALILSEDETGHVERY